MKKFISTLLIVFILASLLLTGCGKEKATDVSQNEPTASENTQETNTEEKASTYPLTITDENDRVVELEKKPEKIVVISGTLLGPFYAVGGEAVGMCTPASGRPTPEGTKDLPTVGPVYNIDMEKLMSLEPDLVIAQKGMHDRFVPILEQSNVPVVLLKMVKYEDVLKTVKILGDIADNSQKAEEIVDNIKTNVEGIVDKLPEQNKKVAILYVTSQDVSVKLENSIAGDVARILKLDNMSKGVMPAKMGSETAPFSMERIVEYDPDVILVTTMVSSQEIAEERIKKDMETNPAWTELRAVKEGNVKYLPQSMFLENAGEYYWKAVEYMAKTVYPEVYGNVDK